MAKKRKKRSKRGRSPQETRQSAGAWALSDTFHEEAMVDVIEAFSMPLLDEFCESLDDEEDILRMGCRLWNVSLSRHVGMDIGRDVDANLAWAMGETPFCLNPDDALNLVGFLVETWAKHFSWCRRAIGDFTIERGDNRCELIVKSFPVPSDTVKDGKEPEQPSPSTDDE